MKYKTIKEMTLEGYAKYPRYVFSNSFNMENMEFWHNNPIKYELVYRGNEYIYVPVGDTQSSERKGGFWICPWIGFDIVAYADNFMFCFESLEKTEYFETILKGTLGLCPWSSIFKNTRSILKSDIGFIRSFFKYCHENKINALDYLVDYSVVKKEYRINRANLNSRAKPYYKIDKEYIWRHYNIKEENSLKILRYQNKISRYEDKINKINEKISELQKL